MFSLTKEKEKEEGAWMQNKLAWMKKSLPVSKRGKQPHWSSFPALWKAPDARSSLFMFLAALRRRRSRILVVTEMRIVTISWLLCCDQSLYCSTAWSPILHYSRKNSLSLRVVVRLLLLCRLCFRCSSSARNKTMSDIHRRVVRRALLQTGHLGVDPEKARRGLLSFRSRRKRGNTKAASGGEEEEDLPVPSAAAPSSKRKRTSDFGVEETIDDGSRSPVKRSSAPSKLPPK